MCTAFVKKGKDLIIGFNFDLALGAFDYGIYKKKNMFYVGITVGSTTYKTHGVNANGNSGNLPYMNGEKEKKLHRGAQYVRLDLLNDSFISGKRTYSQLLDTVREKTVVNIPGMSMHSQFCDADGHILIVEPGAGYRQVDADHSIIANFPVIFPPADMTNPFYGADRYALGESVLRCAGADFSVSDGLKLLNAMKQGGEWATRVSYVYSQSENAVYYTVNGDFENVMEHRFNS